MNYPDYYQFNENFVPGTKFYVQLENTTFLSVYNRFNKKSSRVLFSDNCGLFIVQSLKPKKRKWSSDNVITTTYEKIIVGTKKETTHLSKGTLIQLILKNKTL